MPNRALKADSETYFGNSKTLQTSAHRQMILKFVRDRIPLARFAMIYDASKDGWKSEDYQRCRKFQGLIIKIIKTSDDFILGGFMTAEWEKEDPTKGLYKDISPESFLFIVNEGSKCRKIACADKIANVCHGYSVGLGQLKLRSDSNSKEGSYVSSKGFCSYSLP